MCSVKLAPTRSSVAQGRKASLVIFVDYGKILFVAIRRDLLEHPLLTVRVRVLGSVGKQGFWLT